MYVEKISSSTKMFDKRKDRQIELEHILHFVAILTMAIYFILVVALKFADFSKTSFVVNTVASAAMFLVCVAFYAVPFLLRKKINQITFKQESIRTLTTVVLKTVRLLCVSFLIFTITTALAFAGFDDGFKSPWWVFNFAWGFLVHLFVFFAIFLVEIIVFIKNKKLRKGNKQNEENLL